MNGHAFPIVPFSMESRLGTMVGARREKKKRNESGVANHQGQKKESLPPISIYLLTRKFISKKGRSASPFARMLMMIRRVFSFARTHHPDLLRDIIFCIPKKILGHEYGTMVMMMMMVMVMRTKFVPQNECSHSSPTRYLFCCSLSIFFLVGQCINGVFGVDLLPGYPMESTCSQPVARGRLYRNVTPFFCSSSAHFLLHFTTFPCTSFICAQNPSHTVHAQPKSSSVH
jgi:hypothetical protein